MGQHNNKNNKNIITGDTLRPSADLHNKVAPHKSINVPSIRILSESLT